MNIEKLLRSIYPYADKYGVIREFPEEGLSREAIVGQIYLTVLVARLVALNLASRLRAQDDEDRKRT